MEVPVSFPNGELILTTEESLIKSKLSTIPSEEEIQQMLGALVVDGIRQILLGRVEYKSAGEISRVARDYMAIAQSLKWDQEADYLKNAHSDEERLDAFKAIKRAAAGRLMGIENAG